MRAFDLATSLPWAITEPALRTILEVAARENLNPEAVAAQLGRPLDNSHAVTVRDGVAIIPIDGPVFRRANMFTRISGATSTEALAQDVHRALSDPAITALLFTVDSPGGEATGIHELANMLFAARGRKPMTAYVGGMGASAAYWLASACDEIVCDATAALGSIGVVMTLRDPSKQTARDIEIVSNQSPNKRVDPSTEQGRAQIQTLVDALADVFVIAVARHRNVSVETVLADFGQGGVFVGQGAVDAGLADRLGSFEQVLAELASRKPIVSMQGAYRATAQEESHPMDWKAFFGGLFSAAKEEGAPVDALAAAAAEQPAAGSEQPVAEVLPGAAPSADVAALTAALEQERNARISAEALVFADGLVAGHKALPAEKAAIIAAYEQAAKADLQLGRAEGGLLASVTAVFDARPAHVLTQELVATPVPANATVLENTIAAADPSKPTAVTQERVSALASLTTLGQVATQS